MAADGLFLCIRLSPITWWKINWTILVQYYYHYYRCCHLPIGITPENKDSVQWCLTTPSWEKQARVAAAAMFHTINSSKKNGIPCEEYRHLLEHVTSSRREHMLLEKAGDMMTSSNGNIFRVTGYLCGEFTGPRWIPHTKASDAELWCFLWSASE